MDLQDLIYSLNQLKIMFWQGLDNINVPFFGVSFLIFFLSLFLFNCLTVFLSVLTGGKQDQSGSGRLDNNNHYIYR